MSSQYGDTVINILIWGAIIVGVVAYLRRRRRRPTSGGDAEWATNKLLRAWGMLAKQGLILGRTLGGALICLPRYCHVLLIGGTGSGKGIGVICPNLLRYSGSMFIHDTKGDLYATAVRFGSRGRRLFRFAPFNDGDTAVNPLDAIPVDSPVLIDSAKALAESLVVRQGTETDPFWNSSAVEVITGILVFVLLRLEGSVRNLNSVKDIASDKTMLAVVADKLQEIGGIPGRMGSAIKNHYEKDTTLSKQGASVMAVVANHLSFLDSNLVARAVASSTFDFSMLREPDVAFFIQIDPEQLEAQKGLLRCIISTALKAISKSGSEENSEVLMLIDEASALGSLPAIEEALVRGRSAGVRLLLAYQSASQVTDAFKNKPTLIYDNCGTQIHMGPPSSYEGAERLSKSLGNWTNIVESEGNTWGASENTGGGGGGGGSRSSGGSTNRSEQSCPLLRPEQLLTMGEEYVIAFHRGFPAPILARRVKWYEDAAFNNGVTKWRLKGRLLLAVILAVVLVIALGILTVRAKVNGYGYWTPETKREVNDGKVR